MNRLPFFILLWGATAHAELLSKVDWAKSFESPWSAMGEHRADDYKQFRAKGKKSNDKDLAAWMEAKLTQVVGKPVSFEIKNCDKPKYEQEPLHNRLLQNVIGEIEAIARFDAGKAALQSRFKGVKFACTPSDNCSGDAPKAARLASDCAGYIYSDGYYHVRYQVGDQGDALPFPSSPAALDDFRMDESNGPSLKTQYALALVKKYLPEYQKALKGIELEIDWNAFNRTSKGLPGYPGNGGWAHDYILDGLEELLSRLPEFVKELGPKPLKKIRIVMTSPSNDAPIALKYSAGVITIPGKWAPALGVSDTDFRGL